MATRRMVRASEIGEYVYCHRAWWLHQVVGEEPTGRRRRERGTQLHARHGRRVRLAHLLLLASAALLLLALVLSIVG